MSWNQIHTKKKIIFLSLERNDMQHTENTFVVDKKLKKVQCSYTFAEKAEKINAPFCGAERSKGFRSLFPCFLQSSDLKRKLRKHSAFKIMLRPTARLMALPLQYVFRFESWQIACT